jgi:hypothetical protein
MPIASVQAKQPSALIQVNALCILLMLICARETGAQRRRYATFASGQSLQKRDVRATSVFPLIATEERTSRDVSNVPQTDSPVLCFTRLMRRLQTVAKKVAALAAA